MSNIKVTVEDANNVNVTVSPRGSQVVRIDRGVSGGGGGGSGTVTSISASLPLSVTDPTTTPALSIAQANSSVGGYISAADWTAFNNKVGSITSTDGSVTITGTTTVDLSVAVSASTTNVICQVRNTTGATLTKGTVVYITGATGQIPTVSKALATSDATSAQTLGLMTADLANNSNGYVTIIGLVTDVNTSAYSDGQQLYLSGTTAGTMTATKPKAPTHLVYVAVVEYAHPVHGKLFVKVQNGYELDEIHDVQITSPANGQTIVYDATNNLWKNGYFAQIISVFNYMTPTQIASVQAGDLSADVTTAIQNCINNNPNKKILFPKGKYRITNTITINPFYGYILEGEGYDPMSPDYPVSGSNQFTNIWMDNRTGLDAFKMEWDYGTNPRPPFREILFRNLTISGTPCTYANNTGSGNGIYVDYVVLRLENVCLGYHGKNGLYLLQGFSSVFTACLFNYNTENGVYMPGNNNQVGFTGCQFLGNSRVDNFIDPNGDYVGAAGCMLDGLYGDNLTVTFNNCEFSINGLNDRVGETTQVPAAHGLYARNTSGLSLIGCYAEYNYGRYATNGSGIYLSDNINIDSSCSGVYITGLFTQTSDINIINCVGLIYENGRNLDTTFTITPTPSASPVTRSPIIRLSADTSKQSFCRIYGNNWGTNTTTTFTNTKQVDQFYSATNPTGTGTHAIGDICWSTGTLTGTNPIGWICTTAPNTFKEFGGSAGTPGGLTTQFQYNNAGAFAGASGMTYNSATQQVTLVKDATINGMTVGLGGGQDTTNVALGFNSLLGNSAGFNVGIGESTLQNNTGNNNLAIGAESLYSGNNGSYNVAIGVSALFSNSTGGYNVAIGYNALYNNITGSNNTAIGGNALSANLTGSGNFALGFNAMNFSQYGSNNFAIGANAAALVGYNTPDSNNFAFGNSALNFAGGIDSASSNIAIGNNAMAYAGTNGGAVSSNVAIGNYALQGAGVSSPNALGTTIAIGYNSGASIDGGTNNVIIGGYTGATAPISVSGSNYVILSSGSGTVRQTFNGSGALSFNAGTSYGTAGQLLQSNGSGAAPSWGRTITSGTAAPSGGSDGDIYLQYV